MAEAFGIAAGAIGVVSLSIQLAESLQKVKGFYAAVKIAPAQFEELIEEIEIMQDILSDLEAGSQSVDITASTSMLRCIKVAQRATKRFVVFSDELQTRIKKSKLRGGVKFALSREDIKQMLNQLERTKSSLALAYSLYQQATAEARHAALTSAVSSNLCVDPEPERNTVALTHNTSQVSRRPCLNGDILFRMTTPEWISKTIWRFEMRRSVAGFNIFMRTYGIIPWDAPVLEACRDGDAVEMQRLFDNRLASPFDESPLNMSLWQIASMFSKGDCLRLLSQYDAVSGFSCGPGSDFLAIFLSNAHLDPEKEPLLGVGRRLREELIWLCDIYGGVAGIAFEEAYASSQATKAMRLVLCSPDDADSVWFWHFIENTTTGLSTVPSEETVKDMLNRYLPEHHGNRTALQLAAVAIGRDLSDARPPQRGTTRGLEVIIAAIIANGAGLHDGDHHHTPLLLFLTAILERPIWYHHLPSRPREIQRGLMAWLKIMQKAGVDLVAYGAEESRRFLAFRSLESPVPPLLYWNDSGIYISDEAPRFTFSYGPTPEDWTVRLDNMVDQYVGDFWQMPGLLDEHVPTVPGAWVDGS